MLVLVLQWLSPTSWPVHHDTAKIQRISIPLSKKCCQSINAAPWNPLLRRGVEVQAGVAHRSKYFRELRDLWVIRERFFDMWCALPRRQKVSICSTVRMHSSRSVSCWIHKRSDHSKGTVVWMSAANDADNNFFTKFVSTVCCGESSEWFSETSKSGESDVLSRLISPVSLVKIASLRGDSSRSGES